MLFKLWKKANSIFYKKSAEFPPQLLKLLGFKPRNITLFYEALTPRSAHLKSKKGDYFNYERLEFLGDAILGAVISEYLYKEIPNQEEGYLTKMRSKIVSREHLNHIGNKIGLVDLISKNIKKKVTLGSNVSGDIFESLIGAIYEDQGFKTTKKFIHKVIIKPYVNLENLENKVSSYKSLMLEWCQKNKKSFHLKTIEEENAENIKLFVSNFYLNNKKVSKGRGTSKKKAEENAAKRAFFIFQKKIQN